MLNFAPRALIGFSALLLPTAAMAADHAEAPGSSADPAADITDFYAWNTADGKIVAVLDYSPLMAIGDADVYDADVLYTVHVDNDGDNVSDVDVLVRFGQKSDGSWGVQVADLPGGSAVVSGAVDTVIDAGGGLSVYAGLRDDPFFFDFQGFLDTLSTAAIAFTGTDTFAGYNVMSIVVEMDAATAAGSATSVQLWATTARK
jgi:hypothetical protein